MIPPPPISTLFPYTTLFRSRSIVHLLPVRRRSFADGKSAMNLAAITRIGAADLGNQRVAFFQLTVGMKLRRQDRKSTRLNSSHRCISYAVFCLKKKKKRKIK